MQNVFCDIINLDLHILQIGSLACMNHNQICQETGFAPWVFNRAELCSHCHTLNWVRNVGGGRLFKISLYFSLRFFIKIFFTKIHKLRVKGYKTLFPSNSGYVCAYQASVSNHLRCTIRDKLLI